MHDHIQMNFIALRNRYIHYCAFARSLARSITVQNCTYAPFNPSNARNKWPNCLLNNEIRIINWGKEGIAIASVSNTRSLAQVDVLYCCMTQYGQWVFSEMSMATAVCVCAAVYLSFMFIALNPKCPKRHLVKRMDEMGVNQLTY